MLNPKEQLIKKVIEENPGMSRKKLGDIAYSLAPHLFSNKLSAENSVRNFKLGKRLKMIVDYKPSTKQIEEEVEQILQKESITSSENGNKLFFTEEQLRNMFDIKVIVTNALKQLKEGEFWLDADFVKRFGLIGKPGMRQILESHESTPYRGKASGKIIWSHPKSIEKMKNEGVLL